MRRRCALIPLGIPLAVLLAGGAVAYAAWVDGDLRRQITPLAAVMIMNVWGWRWIFYIFALLGIVWSGVFLFFYRNRPEDEARVNAEELAHIRG